MYSIGSNKLLIYKNSVNFVGQNKNYQFDYEDLTHVWPIPRCNMAILFCDGYYSLVNDEKESKSRDISHILSSKINPSNVSSGLDCLAIKSDNGVTIWHLDYVIPKVDKYKFTNEIKFISLSAIIFIVSTDNKLFALIDGKSFEVPLKHKYSIRQVVGDIKFGKIVAYILYENGKLYDTEKQCFLKVSRVNKIIYVENLNVLIILTDKGIAYMYSRDLTEFCIDGVVDIICNEITFAIVTPNVINLYDDDDLCSFEFPETIKKVILIADGAYIATSSSTIYHLHESCGEYECELQELDEPLLI